MKGTIHKCTEKLVIEKFGLEKWEECLRSVGLEEDHVFMVNDDVDENVTMQLLRNAPAILGITNEQLYDAFGEYWVHVYALKVYPAYYEGVNSTKEFLLKLDNLHAEVTQNIENAKPPRFTYNWDTPNELVMNYSSSRGLVTLFMSLVKGLASFYKEAIEVSNVENKVIIKFL